ncbi:MAG: DUF1540 domain-containing protein [Oscillospiraceae bacterium]
MDCSTKIDCSVCNCAYHDGKSTCTAPSVKVGKCNPKTTCCEDTNCSTFKLNGNTQAT